MIEVWEAMDVFKSMAAFQRKVGRCQCLILDPWYNKGVGGVREDYDGFILQLITHGCEIADHVYLWGFPEIIARFIDKIPPTHQLSAWLTWYYKNNPSVIRGWRSAQNTCLHMSKLGSKLYPEHFLNVAQTAKLREGKLRYIPGPPSVIEAPLNIGFVGRREQLGHPAHKPMVVYERLIRMATKAGDIVFDPMCGSGTTATVCRVLGRSAVLSDIDSKYIQMTNRRLEDESLDNVLALALEASAVGKKIGTSK